MKIAPALSKNTKMSSTTVNCHLLPTTVNCQCRCHRQLTSDAIANFY